MFFSPLEQYDVISFYGRVYGDFFIPNFIIPLFLVCLFFYFFLWFFDKDLFVISSFWQFFFESIIIFVIKIVKQQVGRIGYIYIPLIFTFFIMILGCNLLSLTPFSLALTSHISMVAIMTFTVNLGIFIQGFVVINPNF